MNAEVSLALEGGETVIAVITNSSADSLGRQEGESAYAVIKASELIIGVRVDWAKVSARNVLWEEVAYVYDGAVNSEVEVRPDGGTTVLALIKGECRRALLAIGSETSPEHRAHLTVGFRLDYRGLRKVAIPACGQALLR